MSCHLFCRCLVKNLSIARKSTFHSTILLIFEENKSTVELLLARDKYLFIMFSFFLSVFLLLFCRDSVNAAELAKGLFCYP